MRRVCHECLRFVTEFHDNVSCVLPGDGHVGVIPNPCRSSSPWWQSNLADNESVDRPLNVRLSRLFDLALDVAVSSYYHEAS
jgi:hypothetical protein